MWHSLYSSITGAPGVAAVVDRGSEATALERQQQCHILAAFLVVAIISSSQPYVMARTELEKARSAGLVIAAAYVAYVDISGDDMLGMVPRLLSGETGSSALSWCATAYGMLVLQLIFLPEVQSYLACSVLGRSKRECLLSHGPNLPAPRRKPFSPWPCAPA